MTGQFDTVIAGSKAFALALFAPLTERAGTRPRIAADPGHASALAPQDGLIIVELQSPEWLSEVQRLVAERPTLRVVAALATGAEAAALPLRAVGVEAVAWMGAVAALFPAIDRALGREAESSQGVPASAPPAVPQPTQGALAPQIPASTASPARSVVPAASKAPVVPLDDLDLDVDVIDDVAGAGPVTWPANAPTLGIAEEALLAGLDRTPPPFPAFGAVALQVADALSDLEVKALARAPLQIDGGPIRRAASMRVRVGVAFATAPPRGASSDSASVAALLAEIDDLLAEVNALASDAPPELAPALGGCRNALVKEAIDFSEVAQRYVAVDAPFAQEAPVVRRRAGVTRVRSSPRVPDGEREHGKRQRMLYWVLAVAILAAGGYHGWQAWTSRQATVVAPGASR